MKQRRGFSYAKYGYLFSLPFIIVFILFNLYPTLYTALLGFTDCKGLGNTDWSFLKEDVFKNFKLVLNNQRMLGMLIHILLIYLEPFHLILLP